jgi:hypothetical protein
MTTTPCACPNITCTVRGDCEKYIDIHKGKTYCASSPIQKSLMRMVFKIYGIVYRLIAGKGLRYLASEE